MPTPPRLPPHTTDLATLAVHGGEPAEFAGDGVTPPLVLSATYGFRDTAALRDHFDGVVEREEYGRYGNPTTRLVERKLAALEGAEDAALFASGMAAVTTTLLALLRSGQHVVLSTEGYRRTRQFVLRTLSRFGVEASFAPPGDADALADCIRPETRVVITESPTNPYLRVVDLERLARRVGEHPSVRLVVDATFATPVNQRPLEQGAHLVIHSATKFLAGHNDLLAGAILGSSDLVDALRALRGVLGGVLDPHAAWLLNRGLKTLPLRVERQNATALALARALEQHPRVARVWYPGLPSHPDHAVAARLMRGFGGVITLALHGDEASTARVLDACRIARIAPSLGGVESLIEQPALMSYYELSTEERLAVGIPDTLVRLSVGLEDAGDLLADLEQALAVP